MIETFYKTKFKDNSIKDIWITKEETIVIENSIDIESKKIGAFFGVNAPLTVLLMDGKAHVFRRPSWQNLENRLNEFLAVIDKRTKGDHWGVSLAPDFNPKRWAVASGFALQS